MDQELKQFLELKFEELRAENAEVHTEIAELRTEIANSKMELRAEIEKAETNLLRAFHGWARPTEIRVRSVSAVASGFEERLSIMEDRLSEMERRKAS